MFMIRFLLFKKRLRTFFLDHEWLRFFTNNAFMLFMCVASALVYAIGFRSFISISSTITMDGGIRHLATGGMSGLAQCLVIISQMLHIGIEDYNTMQSIFYIVLNVPILIFSFIKIGVKFSIYTTLNVLCVSMFISYLPYDFLDQIAELVKNDTLARSMFAGLFTGLSSALAFKGNLSAGGVDIVAYYYSLRKSTTSGKYIVVLNVLVVSMFTLLTGIQPSGKFPLAILTALYSITYLFVSSLVVDTINVRNKKVSLQIISSNENLYKVIVANLPHACTIVKAKGGYTGTDKFIIYAVISNSEVNSIVKRIRQIDPYSFINATSLRQVYGRFYIKPID